LAGILCYSDSLSLADEVASAASDLARALGVEAVSLRVEKRDADSVAGAISSVARAEGFQALLVGETRFGTVVAGKVSARLGIGSLGKGRQFRVDGGRLVSSRDVYGGKFVAKVAMKIPCVAVVQQGAYPPTPLNEQRVETPKSGPAASRVSVLERKESKRSASDIRSAVVVVAAGRGFAKREDLALAQGLADALGGALGGSRPLASDLGWIGEDQQIGLTGASVHPPLYVAVGISGQLQHVAGFKDSKVVVAINKDRQAPIFQAADYGIVGDLYEVVPALTKILQER
jgi:electron transfer flavoprotein alpha subunit